MAAALAHGAAHVPRHAAPDPAATATTAARHALPAPGHAQRPRTRCSPAARPSGAPTRHDGHRRARPATRARPVTVTVDSAPRGGRGARAHVHRARPAPRAAVPGQRLRRGLPDRVRRPAPARPRSASGRSSPSRSAPGRRRRCASTSSSAWTRARCAHARTSREVLDRAGAATRGAPVALTADYRTLEPVAAGPAPATTAWHDALDARARQPAAPRRSSPPPTTSTTRRSPRRGCAARWPTSSACPRACCARSPAATSTRRSWSSGHPSAASPRGAGRGRRPRGRARRAGPGAARRRRRSPGGRRSTSPGSPALTGARDRRGPLGRSAPRARSTPASARPSRSATLDLPALRGAQRHQRPHRRARGPGRDHRRRHARRPAQRARARPLRRRRRA